MSVDKCRRVLLLQYATVGNISMQFFNFKVLFVIIGHQSFLNPHISKTHLPISSLNVRELDLK